MAKSLKVNGIQELGAVKNRTKRQYALKRISKADHDFIIDHLNRVEARICEMEEDAPELRENISFG